MKEYESMEEMILAAKKKAISLLTVQDRTESQLRKKLLEQGYEDAVVDEAINYVKGYKYIDDERYAKNYIHYRMQQKSRQQLRIELVKKGVSEDVILVALQEEYEVEERDLIRKLLEKKRYCDDLEYKEKHRIISYLMRRGFQLEDIRSCMSDFE